VALNRLGSSNCSLIKKRGREKRGFTIRSRRSRLLSIMRESWMIR